MATKPPMKKTRKKPAGKAAEKMQITMDEFKKGELHSGSKKGPKVKSRKQAIAIGLKQAGKAKSSKRPRNKGRG